MWLLRVLARAYAITYRFVSQRAPCTDTLWVSRVSLYLVPRVGVFPQAFCLVAIVLSNQCGVQAQAPSASFIPKAGIAASATLESTVAHKTSQSVSPVTYNLHLNHSCRFDKAYYLNAGPPGQRENLVVAAVGDSSIHQR